MNFEQTILTSLLGGSVVAFSAYYFGLRQFLKQKERDTLYENYIKNGIDKVIKRLDEVNFCAYFNYSKALEFLKFFKIAKEEGMDEIDKKVLELVKSKMQQTPIAPESSIYLVQQILGSGSDIVKWTVQALADYLIFNDYLATRLPLEIEKYLEYTEDSTQTREKAYKNLLKEVEKRYDETIGMHEKLRTYFVRLKFRVDEIGISRFKDVKKIPKDKEIKKILEELEENLKKIESELDKN